MAKLTLKDAQRIAASNRPWTLRLECVDPANNVHKFWFATGRGTTESVESGSGRIGTKPVLRLVSFAKFVDKVEDKLRKGYTFVGTRFIRMSPANLAKLGGGTQSIAPMGTCVKAPSQPSPSVTKPAGWSPNPGTQGPCMPALGAQICVWCNGPTPSPKDCAARAHHPVKLSARGIVPAAPATPAVPVKFVPPPMKTPRAGLPALSAAESLIVAVLPVKGGFEGLNKNGDVIMDLTLLEGQDLIQDYGIPLMFSR